MSERPSELRRIAPATVRYIKLGPGGAWEAASLDGGRIDWGDAPDPHELALAEDWEGARQVYLGLGLSPATATSHVRELKDFHTLGSDCLWITFARGYLWWGFAEPEVIHIRERESAEGSNYRKVIGGWRNTDIEGKPLLMEGLSSKLTQLAGYRRTICNVGASDYLVRRINADEEPVVARARAAREELVSANEGLIRQLHQNDFETFVDLIFSRAGWRRVSRLGGTMKDIDLMLEQPLTKKANRLSSQLFIDHAHLSWCAHKGASVAEVQTQLLCCGGFQVLFANCLSPRNYCSTAAITSLTWLKLLFEVDAGPPHGGVRRKGGQIF